ANFTPCRSRAKKHYFAALSKDLIRSASEKALQAKKPEVRVTTEWISIFADQPDEASLHIDPVGAEDARLVSGIGGFERDRVAFLADALQCRFLIVDEGYHDIAIGGTVALADEHR